MISDWNKQMEALMKSSIFFKFSDVIDIEFANGQIDEVYVAISPQQRESALALSALDPEMGVLLYFESASYAPVHVVPNSDTAWYDELGVLLKKVSSTNSFTAYTPQAYSYLYISTLGTIPESNLKVKNARA